MARRSMGVADIKEILVQWDAGEGVGRIARSLGYSRPTVRKYVRAAQQVGLHQRSRQRGEAEWERLARDAVAAVTPGRSPGTATSEVARFHEYLERRVGQVRLSVLHQRLRDEHGLAASWATFYRYVAREWPERVQASPRATVRLDDPPPGCEAQVDFFYMGRWYDPESGRERRAYGFLMTLSHSRHQFLYPVLSEDGPSWLQGHVEAFAFFGGAPRRLVPDNLSAGILRADRYDPRINRAYAELARYYGCVVDPSRAAHPKDKPRVERQVSYARESFFRGREFTSLDGMRREAARWVTSVAGRRVHGTTGERPLEAFSQRERTELLPLPPRHWEPVEWTTAKVHSDCHLQADRARYSVPYRHIGRQLDVRLGSGTVEIYEGPVLVTTHVRRPSGRATRLEHYPEAGQVFLRATPTECRRRATELGPATSELVGALLATGTLHHRREVQAVLRLAEHYESERLERACLRALGAGDGRLRTVRGILERGLDGVQPEDAAPTPGLSGAFLRGPGAFVVGEVR